MATQFHVAHSELVNGAALIAGLAGDRVWIFHGGLDPYVRKPVADALQEYYEALVDPANVKRVELERAGHVFPTAHADAKPCDASEPPFVGKCGYDGVAKCRLHVVFHGCKQGTSLVGREFVLGSGYLETAAANQVALLFPQIEASYQPLNPMGCWDWWGYEGEDFATRSAPQIKAVRTMIADLLGEPRG